MSLVPVEKLRSTNGITFTFSLFDEYRFQHKKKAAPFNLKNFGNPRGTICMYEEYMKCDTEYEAAVHLLGSWPHWLKLCEATWFKPYRDTWEKERETKEISIGKKVLIEEAENGNVTAARTLHGQGAPKKGRPSNQDKEKLTREDNDLDDFLKKSFAKVSVIK